MYVCTYVCAVVHTGWFQSGSPNFDSKLADHFGVDFAWTRMPRCQYFELWTIGNSGNFRWLNSSKENYLILYVISSTFYPNRIFFSNFCHAIIKISNVENWRRCGRDWRSSQTLARGKPDWIVGSRIASAKFGNTMYMREAVYPSARNYVRKQASLFVRPRILEIPPPSITLFHSSWKSLLLPRQENGAPSQI